MVSFREYEEFQLKIIEQSYRERGFRVEYEPKIEGLQYRFDAIARDDSGEIIIIEIVNKYHGSRALRNKIQALEEISTLLPRAKVDFRYIDMDSGVLQLARPRPPETSQLNVHQTLKARLPRLHPKMVNAIRPFLELWTLHVATLRAYGDNRGWNGATTESVLDLYNEMLETRSLVAPEALVDEVTQDLFDLFAEAQGAIQGAPIDRGTFLQLRGHVLEVRKQVRRHISQSINRDQEAKEG